MSYFVVKGCSTLFTSLENANKKALEIANEKLSESLLDWFEKEEHYEDYDLSTGEKTIQTRVVKYPKPKTINSKQELLELARTFDIIVSTYVTELVPKTS